MTPPRFSVIIPTYGRGELLDEAIASVLGQTVDSFECLVIDDGNSQPVVVPSDPRVSVVRRSSNGGTAAARNTGIASASGEVVLFLDDDDQFAEDRLERALTGHARAAVVVCWSQFLGGTPKPGRVLEGDARERMLESFVPNLGQTSIRRDVVPRFDEQLRCCEDVDWWIRTCQQLELATVESHGLRYRRHDGARHLKGAMDRAKARTMILERHEAYFTDRPRARAFQWKRIGMHWSDAGDVRQARAAFARSFRASPSVRTIRHLVLPPRRHSEPEAPA